MNTAIQERVMGLLAAGCNQQQAAMAVGCDESYVSQLMAIDSFREAVQAARGERAAAGLARDSAIDSIEDVAWKKIAELLPMESNLVKVLKVAQAANGAKRRSDGFGFGSQAATGAPIVNITLPENALISFKMTTDRQVVEVEGRTMATMPSHVVEAQLREVKAKRLAADETPLVAEDSKLLLRSF